LTIRTRKLIGTVALLAFLCAYALAAMLAAVVLQVRESRLIEFLFYMVAGLAWVLPAGLLIRWMHRPDRTQGTEGE
jgi:hypothetical protein